MINGLFKMNDNINTKKKNKIMQSSQIEDMNVI